MSAVISSCSQYRYRLFRRVEGPSPKTYAFIGVNPSMADETLDDATVKKMKGFVSRWGGGRIIVGNIYAFRTPYVQVLNQVEDPIGPENDAWLKRIVWEADVVIPCFGNRNKLPARLRPRLEAVVSTLPVRKLRIFGLTGTGDPLHPLMIAYDTPLTPWGGYHENERLYRGLRRHLL